MALNFHPDRTDPRGLQKNQRALELLLDLLFDGAGAVILSHADLADLGADDHTIYLLLAGRAGGQTVLQGLTVEDGLVVNDLGDDHDTRFEGANEVNLLFLDASTDRIGIGTAAPQNRLHVVESSASETVPMQYQNGGGGGVQVRLVTTTRTWAIRQTTAGLAFRDVTGAVEPLTIAQGAPAASFAIGATGRLTMGPGAPRFIGRTSTAADPTTTELPTDKDFGLHKNTSSGAVFLAYNDGGAIKKVALT